MFKKSMAKVSSMAIHEISYNYKTRILTVEMSGIPPKNEGETLYYSDVPPEVYNDFQRADSKGSFFNKFIRNTYTYLGKS